MRVGNVAGTAATALLVFLGTVVAPHAAVWGATTVIAVSVAAIAVTVVAIAVTVRVAPHPLSEYQLQIEAEWDHAWAELQDSA